ncbi:choice-of-anchor M domain-containing protein [Haloferula chungangensis]|uniref:Choice-of-anchor M domain-containing protein n=1 Tax=Haloferula chungangensis TaxID=1048331 RepID=A0ABW2LCU0_9BACT
MTTSILRLGLLSCCPLTATALEPLAEHIDVKPSYQNEAWSWTIGTDRDDREPSGVFFPVRDLPSPSGEKFERPAGAVWDFLGMDAGESVWILPQSDNGSTWPGIESAQSGVFASYVESDPRAAGVAQAWVRIGLVDVEGPGDFSMFQFQGGAPLVWMATSDGITANDVFLLAAPGHSHMSWTFSSKGMYRVVLSAQGYLGPGATNPTPQGEMVSLYFAVGSRAEWRAAHFPSDSVMSDELAGPDADPDKDGRSNLLEYAFGMDPLSAEALREDGEGPGDPEMIQVVTEGETYPAARFYRRAHQDSDLVYAVEWSTELGGGWSAGGVVHEVETIDDEWERVVVRDTRKLEGRGFFRVRVEGPESQAE